MKFVHFLFLLALASLSAARPSSVSARQSALRNRQSFPSPPATPAPAVVYVGSLPLNLRAGPNPSLPALAELPPGEKLSVLGTRAPWLNVRRGNGQEGWVNGGYVTSFPPSGLAAPLPAAAPTTPAFSPPPSSIGGPAAGGGVVLTGPTLTTTVAAPLLNVRSGPGLNYPVVGTAGQGTVITVIAKHRQWRYVRLPNGIEGWVNRTYLTTPVFGVPETNTLAPVAPQAVGGGSPAGTIAPTPAQPPAAGACRGGDVLANVHDPSRLRVLAACQTVSGVVTELTRNPDDGDITFRLRVDSAYENLLAAGNYTSLRGFLQIEIIPADQGSVRAPAIGERVTVTGAWVYDSPNFWNEIHPAWVVAVVGR